MQNHSGLITALTLLTLSLTACASWSKEDTHRAMCNQIKSNIVFSGSTSITRQANIQKAEKPMYQRDYDKNNC